MAEIFFFKLVFINFHVIFAVDDLVDLNEREKELLFSGMYYSSFYEQADGCNCIVVNLIYLNLPEICKKFEGNMKMREM